MHKILQENHNAVILMSRILIKTLICGIIVFLLSGFISCKKRDVYRIAVSQCSSDDWRDKMNEEVKREAMLHDDVEIEIRSADDNSNKQIKDLEYFASNNFDVIVVAPNEAEALTPVIEEIYQKGIPIVIFDRNINGDTYTQHIGVDNREIGRMAAEYALHLFPDSLKIIEIYGLPGSTPAEERNAGFKEGISGKKARIVGRASADWRQEDAELVADSLLKLYPEANLIFAHNDRMAIGASIVAKKAGRNDIKIIGIDGAPNIGVKAVSDGLIDATFLYPTGGNIILREAINIVKGKDFQRNYLLPTASAVDKSNADIILLQNEIMEENTQKIHTLKEQLDNFVSIHNTQTALVYAIIAILILLFGVLFLVLRTFWAHKKHRYELMTQNSLLEEERDKQKELNEKLEEATHSKLVFFTNVSHDLRTPLTLIAEPVAQLKDAGNLSKSQSNLIKIADKNVKILQRLINEVLDFRKYENNKLSLNLTEVDFGKTIEDWLDSFRSVAMKRNIKLILESSGNEDCCQAALDVEKIERVFFNLISNAMKYSPDNSRIIVNYGITEDILFFKVIDSGVGISKGNIPHIFDRFFQVERVRPRGSGIGLSLAKAFVELHNGEISVESEPNKGSTFTVNLPVIHVSDSVSIVEKIYGKEDAESELEIIETDKNFTEDKPVVLIIDDNRDVREMVTELLKDDYNMLTAPNGEEGLKRAYKYVPDLIICDVMMPGMDGMECCRILKSDTITSHIPVLMLTACSLDEQRVQGFENGADAYISKPFTTALLKAQATSLIANRKRVREVLETSKTIKVAEKGKEKKIPVKTGDIDNDFYNRFLNIFEQNMGNPDLNVENLASQLGFERTQLYRKIKAITNYSPVELMRTLRLKKARTLLKSTENTISEICYEVGFSNPAYFTKCYREQFDETPSETREGV